MQKKEDNRLVYAIDLSVIVQFLIFSVMGWVGWNINEIKKDIGSLSTFSQVNATEIERNKTDIMQIQRDLHNHISKSEK